MSKPRAERLDGRLLTRIYFIHALLAGGSGRVRKLVVPSCLDASSVARLVFETYHLNGYWPDEVSIWSDSFEGMLFFVWSDGRVIRCPDDM